ncbi:uncharacterized protein V6R79_002610 [Siganus canaliculatus]
MARLIHLSLLLAAGIQLCWGSVTDSWTCSLCTVTSTSQESNSSGDSDEKCECVETNVLNSATGTRMTVFDTCKLYNESCYNDQHQHPCLEVTIVCRDRFCIVYSEGEVLINKSSNVKVFGDMNDMKCVCDQGCQLLKDICSSSPSPEINEKYAALHFCEEPRSWIDALEYCSSNNLELVEITNKSMQAAVNKLLLQRMGCEQSRGGVWIGLERSIFGQRDVPWWWISGSKAEKPQWSGSFPVDRFNNHCGKIVWVEESLEFKWLDGWCFDKLPFICHGLKTYT